MIRLTRRYRFPCSHRLALPSASDASNAQLYGKCARPHGHGHDYILEVSLRGPVDASSGRVVDVAQLDALVESAVLSKLRYRNLNSDVPEFASIVPTTENLALLIARMLSRAWPSHCPGKWPALERIRLHETQRNIVEVRVFDNERRT